LGGTWDLQFTAPGYRDTIVSNLGLLPGEPLLLDVEMEPLILNDDTIKADSILIFPNPSAGIFRLKLPLRFAGEVSLKVYSSSGLTVYSERVTYTPDNLITIDLSMLPQGVYTVVAGQHETDAYAVARAIIVR
jgi:hypothetical protein